MVLHVSFWDAGQQSGLSSRSLQEEMLFYSKICTETQSKCWFVSLPAAGHYSLAQPLSLSLPMPALKRSTFGHLWGIVGETKDNMACILRIDVSIRQCSPKYSKAFVFISIICELEHNPAAYILIYTVKFSIALRLLTYIDQARHYFCRPSPGYEQSSYRHPCTYKRVPAILLNSKVQCPYTRSFIWTAEFVSLSNLGNWSFLSILWWFDATHHSVEVCLPHLVIFVYLLA